MELAALYVHVLIGFASEDWYSSDAFFTPLDSIVLSSLRAREARPSSLCY